MINKKGIFVDFGYGFDSKVQLDMIKNAGFDSVMLWFGKGNERETVEYARGLWLYISNCHLPFKDINLMWVESSRGDEMTENFLRLIRLAGQLQVPIAVIHISSSFTPPPFGKTGLRRFKKIVDEAEKCKVVVAFENLRRLDYLDYIFENIESPAAKFCYDCGHHNYLYPEVDVLEKYGDKLCATHIHDNFGDFDWHMLPFDGTLDFSKYCDRMSRLEYDGEISLEVHQNVHEMYKDVSPEIFIKYAKEKLDIIYGEIEKEKTVKLKKT